MELMQASTQWASRPADQRFTSLDDLLAFTKRQREISVQRTVATRAITAAPLAPEEDPNRKSLVILGPDGLPSIPSHWSFGQLASLIEAPAGYLRKLPSDIAADAINYGLMRRDVTEIGSLLRSEGSFPDLAALTGPNYGRIWNTDVVSALRERFGDGVTGDFTVPGEFGKAVQIDKNNTTIYGSDRDIFIFLADETNRIEMPNRRGGKSGSLARGFFVWNSEVGSSTLGIATFLFDYACCNRIVWGAQEFAEVRVRHTAGAPYRFAEDVLPAIRSYSQKATTSITTAIEDARSKRLGDQDAVMEFLAKRFTRSQATAISLAHKMEEDRPIETLWDATVGATAYARGIQHQDARVEIERKAGKIMELAR